jgi:hypothetical protein
MTAMPAAGFIPIPFNGSVAGVTEEDRNPLTRFAVAKRPLPLEKGARWGVSD